MRLFDYYQLPPFGFRQIAAATAAFALACFASSAPAAQTSQGEGIGHLPQRDDLSPAQKRLMARRASEIRAAADALRRSLGAPAPEQLGTGRIEVHGRVGSLRTLESGELPDGRWRTVVEVTVPAEGQTVVEDPVGTVLTDYLEFRAGLLRSRERCLENQLGLQRDLSQAVSETRQVLTAALESCRADLAIIDRALADLEQRTLGLLSAQPTTTTNTRSLR